MKLKREGHEEYWELSSQEIARQSGAEPSVEEVAGDEEAPPLSTEVHWSTEIGPGIELHPHITEALRDIGYCVFSGAMVRISPELMQGIEELRKRFENLKYPSFGGEGATGFFAGRKLTASEAELRPAEIEGRDDRDGFLGSLFKATIKALPDYDPSATYPIGWIFSRHDRPVVRMPFHQDRVGWLIQFNIERTHGIHGGSIQLRNPRDGAIVASSSLSCFLDGYIIRDELFEHGTTGITMDRPGEDHRDVLVLRLPAFDASE